MITQRMLDAAAHELGLKSISEARVQEALAHYESEDGRRMYGQLLQLARRFEASGGRGVELAENIDKLRIALAARRVAPPKYRYTSTCGVGKSGIPSGS